MQSRNSSPNPDRSLLQANIAPRNFCRAGNRKRTSKPSSRSLRTRPVPTLHRDPRYGMPRDDFRLLPARGHRLSGRSCADFQTIRRPSRRARQPTMEPPVAGWILRMRSLNTTASRSQQVYARGQKQSLAPPTRFQLKDAGSRRGRSPARPERVEGAGRRYIGTFVRTTVDSLPRHRRSRCSERRFQGAAHARRRRCDNASSGCI